MLTSKPQPISGVSATQENILEVTYPSIGATGLGRLLGSLYEAFPPVSYLLFVLPTAPLAMLIYLLQKATGDRYVVTNRAVKSWKAMGVRLVGQAALADIAEVIVDRPDSLRFYRAGDIRLVNAAGDTLLELRGVPWPDGFRQLILETRDARRQTEASLATIRARQPV